jgi:ribonuclease BN (tRNA processing enzyme)
MNLGRRQLMGGVGATALSTMGLLPLNAVAEVTPPFWSQGTRIVLLGTMAGPVLHPSRMMSSQALFVDGRGYLIDCGYGAIARMTEMGIRLPDLSTVLITHHHSDHNADYPSLVNFSWILGIRGQMKVFGPPPMKRIHEAAIAVQREDIDIRIKATGRQPIESSFSVSEIKESGLVFQDDRVKVTVARVDHEPFEVALAYRFDTLDTSVVFSGDTSPVSATVELARGADTLVHEAMFEPGIDAMLAKRPYVPPKLSQFLRAGHTSVEDVGRIAAQAGVRRLVLTHLLPGDEPVPDALWKELAARHFKGEIVVGHDKLVLSC